MTLQTTTLEAVPVQLVGDVTLVGRIVTALLWNAVGYTEQGAIRVTTDWSPSQEWLISIQDTGTGIPDEDYPHIFEPFWRGEQRPQLPTAGAGLGLPLALALAKILGGSLFVKETGKDGSNFCLQLPMAKTDSTPSLME